MQVQETIKLTDLGFKADKIFNIEINKYSYNWNLIPKNNKIDKIK